MPLGVRGGGSCVLSSKGGQQLCGVYLGERFHPRIGGIGRVCYGGFGEEKGVSIEGYCVGWGVRYNDIHSPIKIIA